MSGHTAATLSYVRTEDGVVKVLPGEPVPAGVLEAETLRLSDARAITATAAKASAGKGRSGNSGQQDDES